MTLSTLPRSSDPLAAIRSWEPQCVVPQYDTRHGYRTAEGVGQVVYRSDTGRALGVVGPRYTAVSHADICALFDALRERNILTDVRCGEFAGGAKIWIQGRPREGGELQVVPGHVFPRNFYQWQQMRKAK